MAKPQPTVFTHFYMYLHRRDHFTWPISGFEHTDDPKERDPNIYWWKQELEHIARAKIDVLTLMFWAPRGVRDDGGQTGWDKFLTTAAEREEHEFFVPKLCCHYDGMGFGDLKQLDLGSDEGIDRVWNHMRQWYDFWTAEGRDKHLFTHDGADVCFMYRPEALGEVTCPEGGRFADELRRRFADRYRGRRLYLVLDMLWTWEYVTNALHATNADNYYFWGGSGSGPTIPGDRDDHLRGGAAAPFGICCIGPGFYDIGHDQSDTPDSEIGKRRREWRDGQTFREDFQVAIDDRDRAPWLLLETWNLFLERSEVTVNNVHGDLFVEISRELAPRFRGE